MDTLIQNTAQMLIALKQQYVPHPAFARGYRGRHAGRPAPYHDQIAFTHLIGPP
jgi:hypothetical protein